MLMNTPESSEIVHSNTSLKDVLTQRTLQNLFDQECWPPKGTAPAALPSSCKITFQAHVLYEDCYGF